MGKLPNLVLASVIAFSLVVPSVALSADRDGDGIEDEDDAFPDHVTIGVASLTGRRITRSDRMGTIREDVTAGFHFFEGGEFAICEITCLFGKVKKTSKKRKFKLRFDKAGRETLAEHIEFALEDELFDSRDRVHDIRFAFDGRRKMKAWLSKQEDSLRIKLFYEHDARILRPKPRKNIDGKTRMKVSGVFSGFAE